ncbi:MAG: EamA family transporter [Rheinheimera sp.]
MQLLFWVTLIWSFSFSLIGEFLAGNVDPYIAVGSRMALALLLFTPFLLLKPTPIKQAMALAGIGAVQLGLMYLLFYHSFLYLSVAEVLLFTILTPVYVTIFDQLWRYRRISLGWVGPAVLAVLGALVIRYQAPSTDFWLGLALVQGANICFAFGQVAYRQLALGNSWQQSHSFGWFFVGASLVAAIGCGLFADWGKTPSSSIEWLILIWLGLVASGVGYWLWNAGARKVNAQQLAVMNNLLIPVGLLVNFALWQHQVNWWQFTAGSLLMLLSLSWAKRMEHPTEATTQ